MKKAFGLPFSVQTKISKKIYIFILFRKKYEKSFPLPRRYIGEGIVGQGEMFQAGQTLKPVIRQTEQGQSHSLEVEKGQGHY